MFCDLCYCFMYICFPKTILAFETSQSLVFNLEKEIKNNFNALMSFDVWRFKYTNENKIKNIISNKLLTLFKNKKPSNYNGYYEDFLINHFIWIILNSLLDSTFHYEINDESELKEDLFKFIKIPKLNQDMKDNYLQDLCNMKHKVVELNSTDKVDHELLNIKLNNQINTCIESIDFIEVGRSLMMYYEQNVHSEKDRKNKEISLAFD